MIIAQGKKEVGGWRWEDMIYIYLRTAPGGISGSVMSFRKLC